MERGKADFRAVALDYKYSLFITELASGHYFNSYYIVAIDSSKGLEVKNAKNYNLSVVSTAFG
jgi:hypothetical protein